MDLYDPARIRAAGELSALVIITFDNGEMLVRDELLAPHPRPPEAIQPAPRRRLRLHHLFRPSHPGAFSGALKETGQLDHTIIIFAADNGLSLGDHGLMGKQNLYEFGGICMCRNS